MQLIINFIIKFLFADIHIRLGTINKMNRTKNYPIKCPEFGGDTLDEYPKPTPNVDFCSIINLNVSMQIYLHPYENYGK